MKFVQNKMEWNIKTKKMKKNYGFVYDKRVLFKDLSTIRILIFFN